MDNRGGLLEKLKALLFARELTCANCGAELFAEEYFCPHCLKTLPFNAGHICSKCGRAVGEEYPVCLECKADMPLYDAARSAFRYEGDVVRLVKKFKTGGQWLAAPFASRMAGFFGREFAEADFLVHVPMTAAAQKKRGYNQSFLLAEELSARTCIPHERELLVKTRETPPQKELSRRERAENLAGSFRVHERAKCRGKTAVLVDDVLTTGATVSACARALKGAGAKRVWAVTAASVPSQEQPGVKKRLNYAQIVKIQ